MRGAVSFRTSSLCLNQLHSSPDHAPPIHSGQRRLLKVNDQQWDMDYCCKGSFASSARETTPLDLVFVAPRSRMIRARHDNSAFDAGACGKPAAPNGAADVERQEERFGQRSTLPPTRRLPSVP